VLSKKGWSVEMSYFHPKHFIY